MAEPLRSVYATMASAAKFWPTRLFGFGAKPDAEAEFRPKTEMAARIIGRPAVPSGASDSSNFASGLDPEEQPDPRSALLEPANDVDVARQSERFVPVRSSTVLTDRRGKGLRARIINVSSTGVAIEADFRAMPPETVTMVGSKTVVLGRAIRGGQVFLFDKPLDPARCNSQIVL